MIKQFTFSILIAACCSGFIPGQLNRQPAPDSTKKIKQKPVKPVCKPAKSNVGEPADLLMFPLLNRPGL
jgi:hypothetical protein